MEMTERRLTLEILLSLSVSIHVHDGFTSHVYVSVYMYTCARAPAGRFVSQFLIGLEALNVRLYQSRAQVHRT